MAKSKRRVKPLATIWNCPDELWEMITPVLAELDPPHKGHRQRVDQRAALDGIIYHIRSGCQWNHLPRDFGDDSSVHRTMQRWIERGVFDRVWGLLVESCQELDGVDWEWQSADGALGKARFGGITSARIPRIAASPARNAAF
jgi:putative transposase